MNEIKDIINESERLKADKKFDEAISMLEKSIVKYNNDYRLYEQLADIYLYKWDTSKADKSTNYALNINPESAAWNYLKWFILLSKNKINLSLKYLEKSNSIMKNNPEVLRNLGWAYTMAWENFKWIMLLKRALNIAPKDELITKDLAMALIWEWKVKEWNQLLEGLWLDID